MTAFCWALIHIVITLGNCWKTYISNNIFLAALRFPFITDYLLVDRITSVLVIHLDVDDRSQHFLKLCLPFNVLQNLQTIADMLRLGSIKKMICKDSINMYLFLAREMFFTFLFPSILSYSYMSENRISDFYITVNKYFPSTKLNIRWLKSLTEITVFKICQVIVQMSHSLDRVPERQTQTETQTDRGQGGWM